MRIFDNPNHPKYGPVRRLWVVLVQLDMLNAAERWSQHNPVTWDEWLATRLAVNPLHRESAYQRELIGVLLEGWL